MEVRKRFENDKLKKLQIFNGAQLKYIAFISMLIDHVNNAVITPFLNGKGFCKKAISVTKDLSPLAIL